MSRIGRAGVPAIVERESLSSASNVALSHGVITSRPADQWRAHCVPWANPLAASRLPSNQTRVPLPAREIPSVCCLVLGASMFVPFRMAILAVCLARLMTDRHKPRKM